MSITTYKWSIKHWHELINSGLLTEQNVELIKGEICLMSPESFYHSFQNITLAKILRATLASVAEIREGYPITLQDSEPQPDIAVVSLPDSKYRYSHPISNDIYLLVEISNSTLNFDLSIKADLYAANNILEYWVVDLVNQKIIIHTLPENGQYQKKEISTSLIITPQAFANIKVNLTTFFR